MKHLPPGDHFHHITLSRKSSDCTLSRNHSNSVMAITRWWVIPLSHVSRAPHTTRTSTREKERPLSQPSPSLQRHTPTPQEFIAAQRSPEFQELRSKQRGFTFPLAIAGVVWFTIYIVTAMYAPSFFATKLVGNINVGILFGFLQFVSTFAITWFYVKFADKHLEPRSRALREALENGSISSSKSATGSEATPAHTPHSQQGS